MKRLLAPLIVVLAAGMTPTVAAEEPSGSPEAQGAEGLWVVLGEIGGEASPTAASAPTACFVCHGLYGVGDGSGAVPRLTGQNRLYLREQLEAFADGRRPSEVMTPIAQSLEETQIEAVSRYYSKQHEAYFSNPVALPGLIRRGAGLTVAGKAEVGVIPCEQCHGQSGVAPTEAQPNAPILAGQYASYTLHQLQAFKSGDRSSVVMEPIAQGLNEEDMRALALFFESVRPVEEDGK